MISPFHSAFVLGRLIFYYSLLVAEVGHFLHNRWRGSEGFLALKLDLSKAYNRVEWGFLEAMLLRLGFAEAWVRVVMICVTSVSYFFMVNWEAKGYLEPLRGLRQGDLISPYLFMLCVEGLLALISQNERKGVFHGIHINDTASSLHHLLFADDNFFFTCATMEDCGVVQHILDIYSQASG